MQRRRDEAGFSIPELIVAMSILAIGMLILTASLANTLRPLSLAKQRTAATAAAQELIEVSRSLAWSDLGVVAGDTTLPQNGGTDPSVVNVGGVWKFGQGCPSSTPCEPVQYATNISGHPFTPHKQTLTRTPSTITRYVYVTGLDTNSDGVIDFKRVTVRATFSRTPIQGVSATVRLSTLVSSTQFGGTSPNGIPLTGTVDVTNGTAALSAAVGAGAMSNPLLLELTNPFAKLEGILTTRSQVSCTARAQLLQVPPSGTPFGPASVSTLADDDPLTATPTTQGPTTTNWVGNGIPGDISAWVAQASLPSSQTCLSTVLGPNGSAGGDDDLAYGSGSGTGSTALTLQANAAPVLAALGTIQLLSVNASTAAGTVDAGPVGTVVSTATQTGADTKVMVINAPLLPTAILASNGLFRVESLTSTATATGQQTGSPPAPSVSSGTMKIWIYDPLLLVPGCTSRSVLPSPLGYCIITRSVTTPLSVAVNLAIPQLLLPTIRYSVTITGGVPSTTTNTGATGTTWQARLNPLTATVRMCLTTAATCVTTAGKTLDLQTTLDLGSVFAQVVKGFGP